MLNLGKTVGAARNRLFDERETELGPASKSTPHAGLWHDVSGRLEGSALDLGGKAFVDGAQLLGCNDSKRLQTPYHACVGDLAGWTLLLQYRATLPKIS